MVGPAIGSTDVALQGAVNKVLMHLRASGQGATDQDIFRASKADGSTGVTIDKLGQLRAKLLAVDPVWGSQNADYTIINGDASFQALSKAGAQTITLPLLSSGPRFYYFCDFVGDAATQAKKIQPYQNNDYMYGIGVTGAHNGAPRDYFQMTKNYQSVLIACSASRWFVLGAT
jgi:hypothetical protein